MSLDLYRMPLDGVTLRNRCGGNLGSENQQCVEYSEIPGTTDGFVVGDSKNPDAGQLRFTKDELTTFARGFLTEQGLTA
ncbi:DUF397 domain-containing protein [Micromonospora sp. KC207]|uniref:DUF397 domain-containing protein n=1 Tax=Micromonospora sp. KC207 TaxID=2530377 RepID=UPI00104E3E9E|nr:DUF397 domain-containing protein [Micromonospora sp. KC207]TDC64732.1 DUF397 domain-containing protein [Micromonospora sp. KC207]